MAQQEQRRAVVVDTSNSPHARLRPVPVDAVRLDDGLWEPRRRLNRELSLPGQHELLEQTGRIDNFRRAAGKQDGPHQGIYFNDSDVYKWLEAAAWMLADGPDPELDRLIDKTIVEVAAAQQPDGYLDTYYQLGMGMGRWTELARTHELYCAGHLIQAAVAHHRATGKHGLLDVARRCADCICATLGPAEQGKQPGTDGHEEIEMAMVELWRETGERRYLDQARYFLDARGHGLAGGDEYHQDHTPFRSLDAMVGHAVRAVYLNAGAADVWAETGEPALQVALDRLWENMTTKRMYVSGGIGSRYEGEAFGEDYELPNQRAYAESCAAIGSVMWSWRMLLATGESRYADLIETTLYNAVLPGISLDGRSYFYQNPLSAGPAHRRQAWFDCACCPPNIARLLASLPGYSYSVSDEGVWTHLYAQGAAELALSNGSSIRLRQRTAYPWDGEIELDVEADAEFTLYVRVPAWCMSGATIEINGTPFEGDVQPGSYGAIRRAWRPGDTVRLRLPMDVRLLEAHPHLSENRGRLAVFRGPLLYCVEQAGNSALDPRDILISTDPTRFVATHDPNLLGGVTTLQTTVTFSPPSVAWSGHLYRPASPVAIPSDTGSATITHIPYYAWANREPGRMEVWLRAARRGSDS
jgi:DUF1680 family protein